MKIHKNDHRGLQFEFEDVLFTLRPNEHHSISGNVAVQKAGKIISVGFHGKHPELAFPLEVHDEEEIEATRPSERAIHKLPQDCADSGSRILFNGPTQRFFCEWCGRQFAELKL